MKKVFDKGKKATYLVDEDGNVYFELDGVIKRKKPTVHKRGYVYVRTVNKNHQLHRIVAKAFLDNPLKKPTVNHIDGNKENNCVSNLEWATSKENARHAIENNLTKQMKKNEGNLKYSNCECRDVINRVKSGISYIKAGEKYNMPYSTVAHLIRGSRRKV